MVKKLFIVFLSLSILSFLISINDYLGLDLVFALDPDNYDILGFVSWNYNLDYVIFIVVSLTLLIFVFLKSHLYNWSTSREIHPKILFAHKLQTRSPPF